MWKECAEALFLFSFLPHTKVIKIIKIFMMKCKGARKTWKMSTTA